MADNEKLPESQNERSAAVNTRGKEPLLRMVGIGKTFAAGRARAGGPLALYRVEVLGLVGDNGAGKSTLVKTISGVGPADEGECFFEGQPVMINSPQAATK